MDTYTPRGKNAAILDRAYDLVQAVPYQVSLRWLFYRLLQEGYYRLKSDYKNKWEPAASAARHAFYKGWRPDTLADETREIIYRSDGFADDTDWLYALAAGVEYHLDKWQGQDYYAQLWFEARAMIEQFAHYTDHIDLVPMAGQPSIPYKWKIGKELETADRYGLPIVILYFGDLDQGGENIERAVETHVRERCSAPFEFIRCGLSLEQAQHYRIPENFEKPGAYQWEALDDGAAREVILAAVKPYLRHDAFQAVVKREQAGTAKLRAELQRVARRWNGV